MKPVNGAKPNKITKTIKIKKSFVKVKKANPAVAPKSGKQIFLTLPAELRNSIYELVIISPDELVITKEGNLATPPLLQVCKQIRCEALTMYYAENCFRALVDDHDACGLEAWLKSKVQPDMRKHIRKFKLEHSGIETGQFSDNLKIIVCRRLETGVPGIGATLGFVDEEGPESAQLEPTYWFGWMARLIHLSALGLDLDCLNVDAQKTFVGKQDLGEIVKDLMRNVWRATIEYLVKEVAKPDFDLNVIAASARKLLSG